MIAVVATVVVVVVDVDAAVVVVAVVVVVVVEISHLETVFAEHPHISEGRPGPRAYRKRCFECILWSGQDISTLKAV